jgi:hypothetical protein
MRVEGQSFATYHANRESFEREIRLVEKEQDMEFNFIETQHLDWECCLDDFPDGSALAVSFDKDAAPTEEKSQTYVSPFTGRVT